MNTDASQIYDCLKISNQLCFPLYAAAKEVVRRYKPFLDEIDLTYTQYITMMILWEQGECNVKELGECLYLDSGTLTPLLKKLEQKGLLRRHRSEQDERNLMVSLTEEGYALREKAVTIPPRMGACVNLNLEEAMTLKALLSKLLGSISPKEEA